MSKKFCVLILLSFCLSLGLSAQKSPRINHIAFSVHDLKIGTRFYQQIIGLDTIPEPFHDGRHTWFAIGDYSHLHLIQNPGAIVTPPKQTHLCFSVPSVDVFVAKLIKAGIPYEDWAGTKNAVTVRVDKIKQVYLQDPDGYWLEVNDDWQKQP
jgi:lactoylglutathione lyase